MDAGTRRATQIFLAAGLVLSAGRMLWVLSERWRGPDAPVKTALPPRSIHPDLFVHLPRSYLTDLDSARRMKGALVWVRDGHRYPHFPFDPRRRRTQEIKDPPLLPPILAITIADVTREPIRGGADEVNFIFEYRVADPSSRSVTIGHCGQGSQTCRFYVDDMFFLKNPRELYAHWRPEVWAAIERSEVAPGMSETQVSFALGYGRPPKEPAAGGDRGSRIVEFRPPGRAAVHVTIGADGNALKVEAAP